MLKLKALREAEMTPSTTIRRAAGGASALLLLAAITGCTTPELAPQPGDEPGTERERLTQAVEAHFTAQNGTVVWDGGMLILELDGDADADAFEACEALETLGAQMESTLVAFPNGEIPCEEALFG